MPAPAPHRWWPSGHCRSLAVTLLLVAPPLLSAASPPAAAAAEPPVTYTIQATTLSGLGALAAGDLSAGGMMRLLMGGAPPSSARTLELSLEAPGPAPGALRAEHRVPEGLRLGPVLPLVPPLAAAAEPGNPTPGSPPERPQGRLLLFHGCADQADGQQPQVVSLERLLPDQQALARRLASMGGLRAQADGLRSGATVLGRWPNAETRGSGAVPAGASLVGAHTVSGGTTPTLNFSLDSRHDFLAPVELAITAAGGASLLRWQPVAGAEGYLALVAGAGRQEGDLVIWTSSSRPWGDTPFVGLSTLSGGLQPSSGAAGQEKGKSQAGAPALLPLSQTSCAVSAQAMQAMQAGVLTFVAPAVPQRLQEPGVSPGWQVQVERQSLLIQPLMEGMPLEMPARQEERAPAGGGGTFNLFKGLF
ncbi:hypothetical protein [Cyanobium sp. NIES-981]|uniref:hypothetical protein n=1 Tax=Cyanobium sp. NIES-981 TaxID=1851505 RepID=UPI0007DDBD19|nr:hypothetical protein [Cyanobium sp. NIES-981]SBO43804.1 conserved exported protein of unknown function [Cyanobium sp. NIES-981]